LTKAKYPTVDIEAELKKASKSNWSNKTNAPSIDFENMSSYK
jgi:hypothetical protein